MTVDVQALQRGNQACRFPWSGAKGYAIAIHTLKVAGLLVINLKNSYGTFVTVLVILAYSPVGYDGMSIDILDAHPKVLQFKDCHTMLASLMPKIPLRLLDRWISSLPNRL